MSYIHRSLIEEKIQRAIHFMECARNLTNFKNKAGVKENSIILCDYLIELWNFKKSPMKSLIETQLPYFLKQAAWNKKSEILDLSARKWDQLRKNDDSVTFSGLEEQSSVYKVGSVNENIIVAHEFLKLLDNILENSFFECSEKIRNLLPINQLVHLIEESSDLWHFKNTLL